MLPVLFAKSGHPVHRNTGHYSVHHFVDPDIHVERRMENDTDRCAGPERGQDNFRHQPLHDDSHLDVAHNRRHQEEHVYDATMGSPRINPGDRAAGKRTLYSDHVLRESRTDQWNLVAHHRSNSSRDLHVLMAGGIQLLPAAKVR